MSRFGRHSHLPREPDYGVTSAWDTRTYLGLDDNGDEGGEPDCYSRRTTSRDHHRKRLSASVSVIGYGDPEPRPTRAKPLSFRTSDGERRSLGTTTRDRDRPRTTTGATRQYRDSQTTISVAPAYHHHRANPFTTPGTSSREHQQPPTLKQRLSLSRQPTPERDDDDDDTTGGFVVVRPPFQHYLTQEQHHQQQPPRARSLSLSRAPGYASYPYYPRRSPPSSVSSHDDEEGVLSDELASYQHRRVSLSASPPSRAQWSPVTSRRDRQRQRSVEVEVEGDGGWWVKHEQEPERQGGYAGVRRRTDPVEARRSCDDDLRCRLGVAREKLDVGLADPRSAGRRSRSFEGCVGTEGVGGRRKGLSPATRGRTASNHRDVKPQYNQVHALVLTWSFHDLRTEDYTAPPAADYVSLEDETARLRATLEGYGYAVHEFLIPMHRSAESLKAKLKQFCRYAADDTLLIVYYHGHGALNDDNELVFSSHDHPNNPQWSQAAAAELYAALLSGDTCASHGHRQDRYQELIKKYERYRPVSTVKWAAIRNAILSAPSDVLLVLDCCAAGGANLPPRYLGWQPPATGGGGEEKGKNRYYTKHLFAACGFESSTSDDMTAAMCEVLDEAAVPPAVPSAPGSPERGGFGGGKGGGNGRDGREAGGGGVGGQGGGGGEVLTTKRLHQLMEDKLQKRSVGSQPIFKQLLPQDPEQYITLPNFRDAKAGGERRGRRGYVLT